MMKRFVAIILIFSLALCCAACTRKNVSLKKPAAFYYCNAEVPYDGKTGGITAEMREAALFENDMIALLNEYLSGPLGEGLHTPFPANVRIASFNISASTVTVVLSREFSQLSGLDLIIACACLSRTLFDMMEQNRIQIAAYESLLDGQAYITFDRSSILFVDDPLEVIAATGSDTP
jgi:hypothetical protein